MSRQKRLTPKSPKQGLRRYGVRVSEPRLKGLPESRYFSLEEFGTIEAALEAAKAWRRSQLKDVHGAD